MVRQPIIPQLNGPEFLLWEQAQSERYELNAGFVFAFAGGTAAHDRLAFNMRTLLESAFPSPCRTFGSDMKVRISSNTYYYPDVAVGCDTIADDATVLENPRIVVEVLSAATRGYDLVEKRAAYRTLASLRAYVVIDTDIRRVEVDRRDFAGKWETETFDVGEALLDGSRLSLDAIYAETAIGSR